MDAYVSGFIRTRRLQQYSENTRRLVFGGGHNASIPAAEYFQVLADVPDLADCIVYIRFLGTKNTLTVDIEGDMQSLLSRINRDLVDLSTAGLQHRIDLCLSVTGRNMAAFLRKSALASFASQFAVNPQFYHILSFTSLANMQGACQHESIRRVNFYSAILQNIRSLGELPTKDVTVISHLLLSPANTCSFHDLANLLEENSNKITALSVLLQQLSDRSVPARFELTTDITSIPRAQNLLRTFVLDTSQLRSDVIQFTNMDIISDYIQSMMTWASVTLRETARNLRSRRMLPPEIVKRLVLLEDLILHTFLYGQGSSATSRHARLRGVANASDLAIFDEFDLDLTITQLTALVSTRLRGFPHYWVTLSQDLNATDISQASIEEAAEKLAFFVVLCLNAEVEMRNYRREYGAIDTEASFLFRVSTLAGLRVQHVSSVEEAAKAIFRLFFIKRTIKSYLFHKLHDLALQM